MSTPRWKGWTILGVASVALVATSPGQTFTVSLFNLAMQEELSLSASALSGAYMVATLASASVMTWVGKGSDRFGPGRLMVGAALGLCIATIWMSNIVGLVSLAIGFFGLRFFGQGALMLASGHALAMWFERRLGVAQGIRLTVFGLAMLVAPSLVAWSIHTLGWRTTWPLIGGLSAVAVVSSVVLFHQDRPEDSGSTLDGAPPPPTAETQAVQGSTLGQAIRNPVFWAVAASSANSATLVTALMFQVQPLALAKGLGAQTAPSLIASYALLSTSLFFVAGWIGDRLQANAVFAAAAVLYALGGLSFMTWTPSHMPYVGMAAMGTAAALLGTSVTPTLARCFGRAHHGAIRGMVSTIGVAGTAIGPFVLGVSKDLTGSFDGGVGLFVAGSVLVAALVSVVSFSPDR